MRRKLIAANWKMHGDRSLATDLCTRLTNNLPAEIFTNNDIVICPPYVLFDTVSHVLKNNHATNRILLGGQDVDENPGGAFTGQISAAMLIDSGCNYVIVGHSERRAYYFETDALAGRKAALAISAGLSVIYCVGETLAQRKTGATEQVIAAQLHSLLKEVGSPVNLVIAYEPVWAIGSGKSATPDQAQAVHKFIRDHLAAVDKNIAAQCRIIYGGSMNQNNAAQLIAQPDIDGGLIGGASLDAEAFIAICQSVSNISGGHI